MRDLIARDPAFPGDADEIADRLGAGLALRVTLIAADGTVLGDTDLGGSALATVENHAGRPEVRAALGRGEGQAIRHSTSVGDDLLYVALRIDPADPSRGVARLAIPLTAVRRAQEEMRLGLLAAVLISILAAALFGYLAALRTARRLEAISQAASDIAAGRTEARARPGGTDEIGALARSVNRMADQLHERLMLLTREKEQLHTVIEGMTEGVLLTDGRGVALLANPAFHRLLGVSGSIAGRRPLELARIPALQEAVDTALSSGEPVRREIEVPGPPARILAASLVALPEGPEPVGVVAVFHDITEQKDMERIRREFVANVSHELRTPLTAIRGYAETLRDGGLHDPERAVEFVEVIHRHTRRLQALIDDLLDLSAIEQGRARIALTAVSLPEVAAQVEGVIRPAADGRHQSLRVDLPAALPAALADRDRLAQVLINLLDNAVKFTPEGGLITLAARASHRAVLVTVTDTGVGIPPGEIGRIFERFYRVERSRDRREGGTGLGLAIAKHLVQSMGGSIEVESNPGSGTTFRLRLQAA